MARKCNGENFCLDVPLHKVIIISILTELMLINTNALHVLQIDADKEFNFVARAYLEPPTKVGPNGSELLMPYVLYVST